MICRYAGLLAVALLITFSLRAQDNYELNSGWKCKRAKEVSATGIDISKSGYSLSSWMPAIVPGTVLTTQLANKQIPDPYYGMNNKLIPDIYNTGADYYTYWFVTDFKQKAGRDKQTWLNFRGVNYSCDVFLNGHKVNDKLQQGMFLRYRYNITGLLAKNGRNRLAVIVHPPVPYGKANGGQGGDGMIGHCVTNQYVLGWDWIQPIRDRNTGIWDKVTISNTGAVSINDPQIIMHVPGKRNVSDVQDAAIIDVAATLENASADTVKGILQYALEGNLVKQMVNMLPHEKQIVYLPALKLSNPKLWWPNGYGEQSLYTIKLQFVKDENISDEYPVTFGIRELSTHWNDSTQSREVLVNGQKIFVKGGNWIVSDAMLRLSKERYDAEVQLQHDMNLNFLRVWGGGITERPEFYDACDKYGLLVMQDFWISGDCNGKWDDTLKTEDTLARRNYPDDHQLFLASCKDQIKMLRNHPSLAIWSGGNETTPPDDILDSLFDITADLDESRYFLPYSNDDSICLSGWDGPYNVQHVKNFWTDKNYGFNSEVGSVGIGDMASLERFMPKQDLVMPEYNLSTMNTKLDSVWEYHEYLGYDSSIFAYGQPKNLNDFLSMAQLVNYDQYRGIAEGFSAHMWDWYTGVFIWKTQTCWPSLRGQLYDYYLDPNAGLFGLKKGAEPLHIMFNPADSSVMVVNNGFADLHDLRVSVSCFDTSGKIIMSGDTYANLKASSVSRCLPLVKPLKQLGKLDVTFLSLKLYDIGDHVVSSNLYWLSDMNDNYPLLKKLPVAKVNIAAKYLSQDSVAVTISNGPDNAVAF
ncbi:MAG: glycoside hydrolase family 2 protein, partial [Flavipsychrobacter sp.]